MDLSCAFSVEGYIQGTLGQNRPQNEGCKDALGFIPGCKLRSVAQLVEHRSPKPGVMGSSPFAPANAEALYVRLVLTDCF